MPVELKDVRIKCISILIDDKQPANKQGVIIKDDGKNGKTIEFNVDIYKFEPEGFLVIRPMISDDIDTDDEFYKDFTIKDAAYSMMKNIQIHGGTIFDTNHDFDVMEDVYFGESYIIKEDGKDVWEMKVDIRENETLMQKAKEGKINGVSIAGSATKVKVKKFEQLIKKFETENESLFKDLKVEDLTKDFDSVLSNQMNNDIYLVLSTFWDAVYNAFWNRDLNDPSDFKKEFATICKQAIKHVNGMTFEYIEKKDDTNPKNNKGDAMEKQVQDEVQALIDTSITKALGLEDGQTIADLIKSTVGEIKPPELPMVITKDAEGVETKVTLVETITKLNESFEKFKTDSNAKMEEIEKAMTGNKEIVKTDDELAKEALQEKRRQEEADRESKLT